MVESVETLPWVAEKIRERLPDIEGRALAVSWGEITKDTKPSLPIAIVAPADPFQNFEHNGGTRVNVAERFSIEFWLTPARIKRDDGAETPFWSYYAANAFRDRLINLFSGERTPGGGEIAFERMQVEADDFALVIAFGMVATYEICSDDEPEEGDGLPAEIVFTLK